MHNNQKILCIFIVKILKKYIRMEPIKVKKLPIGEISGIISVVKDEKGNDKILISANEKSRYSQLITNEFFKEIK